MDLDFLKNYIGLNEKVCQLVEYIMTFMLFVVVTGKQLLLLGVQIVIVLFFQTHLPVAYRGFPGGGAGTSQPGGGAVYYLLNLWKTCMKNDKF